MATYGQRDKFLQAVVTFTISEQAKEMPAPERQDLLVRIRDKYAPDITNDEWSEIAKGINNFKFIISDSVKYGEVPSIIDQLPEAEIDYQKTQADQPHLDESMKKDVVLTEKEIKDQSNDIEETPDYENSVDAQESDNSEDDSDDNSDLEDVEGTSKEDDYSDDEKPREQEPTPEPAKVFGKFTKPKEPITKKVSTSKLRGLLKPKK